MADRIESDKECNRGDITQKKRRTKKTKSSPEGRLATSAHAPEAKPKSSPRAKKSHPKSESPIPLLASLTNMFPPHQEAQKKVKLSASARGLEKKKEIKDPEKRKSKVPKEIRQISTRKPKKEDELFGTSSESNSIAAVLAAILNPTSVNLDMGDGSVDLPKEDFPSQSLNCPLSPSISVAEYISTSARSALISPIGSPSSSPTSSQAHYEKVEGECSLKSPLSPTEEALAENPAQCPSTPCTPSTPSTPSTATSAPPATEASWSTFRIEAASTPVIDPNLTDEEWVEVKAHHSWLKGIVRALFSLLPENLKMGCQGSHVVLEDTFCRASNLVVAVRLIEFDFDEFYGEKVIEEDDVASLECGVVRIDHTFMKLVKQKWIRCRTLHHLPTLNLFFAIFENILLLGKSLHIVLHKNHVVDVVDMMQYNPKLNSRLHEWPTHSATMSKKRNAFPLHPKLDDYAKMIYCMQYIKDRVLPWVCDESRFAVFNQVLQRLKGVVVHNIWAAGDQYQSNLFTLIANQENHHRNPSATAAGIKFLCESLEMCKENQNVCSSKAIWETLLGKYNLMTTVSEMLCCKDMHIRKLCCELCCYLTDEECRRQMHSRTELYDRFLQSVVEMWSHPECDEVCALQMQAVLPVMMMYPSTEVLTVFYKWCGQLASRWCSAFVACVTAPNPNQKPFGTALPTTSCINAFMEMCSLCIHHHFKIFALAHDECIGELIHFVALLWKHYQFVPKEMLIGGNKVILSTLLIQSEGFYTAMISKDVFRQILFHFTNGNNLVNSSILTLLHTILQLNPSMLIEHICGLWTASPSASPLLRGECSVQQSFFQRSGPLAL